MSKVSIDEEDCSDGSGSDENSGEEEETSTDSNPPEDDDEPILNYKRFAKETIHSIHQETKNVITCIAVHEKFIAVGTVAGVIYLLDHTGVSLAGRDYALHSAQVNQISVDLEGEILASCSDDGKVCITGLFNNKYNNILMYDRAVKSVAVNPHFSKGANQVVTGTDNKLSLFEERRWLVTNVKSSTDLHAGYGVISTIKWRDNLIAWANEKMVMVYDTTQKETIATILFDEERFQTPIPTSLCWQKNDALLVGRGHIVKMAKIETENSPDEAIDPASVQRRKKYMSITAQNVFPKFLVCGVVVLSDDEGMDLVVLGYDSQIDMKAAVVSGEVPPPHLLIVPPGMYDSDKKAYSTPEEKSKDKLLPKGYKYFQCWEYHLECVEKDDRFYIVTPTDIILAEKRTAKDHVDWLLERKRFEAALQYAENPRYSRTLPHGKAQSGGHITGKMLLSKCPYSKKLDDPYYKALKKDKESVQNPHKTLSLDIGVKYIYHLLKHEKFDEAATKCPQFLGPNDKKLWEDVIMHFLKKDELLAVQPFIPTKSPQLSPALYELVLNSFLGKAIQGTPEDEKRADESQILIKLIRVWPSDIYSTKAIIVAVKAASFSNPHNTNLLDVLALLYSNEGMIEEALKLYLQQKNTVVFELIKQKRLFNALLDNLIPLMELNIESTVQLLIECHEEVPATKVVQQMTLSHAREEFIHQYLDSLFEKDSKAGVEYHERQVELYAKYDRGKLLRFLRTCPAVPLEKALLVCEQYKCYEEMVYILREMGNTRDALLLIIKELENVEKAIEFATEQKDDELWGLLINESVQHPTKKSEFVTGLLKNVGTHIDPTVLITAIKKETNIPELGNCLVKLLQDFSVQVNLTEGCRKILVKDSQSLMSKLHKMQARAVCVDADAVCKACGDKVMENEEVTDYVIFFCGHIYHKRCAAVKDMLLCRYCFGGTRPKRNESSTLKT